MYLFINDFLPGYLLLSLVQSAMSRNSFEELMRYLHVNGNSSLDTDDRMNRVPPLMTLSNKTFLSFFKVLKTQNITFHPLQSSQDPKYYFSSTSKFSRPKILLFIHFKVLKTQILIFHLLQSSQDPNTYFSPTSKFTRPKHLVFHLLQSSQDPNTLFLTYFKTQTP